MDSAWTHYMQRPAPKGILCQFMREGGEPWVGTSDFGPMFDVGSLYWRLTGIGRMKLESLPPGLRAQIEPSFWSELMANGLMGTSQLGGVSLGMWGDCFGPP